MLADGGEFGARDARHGERRDFAAPPEVEEHEGDDANLLVGCGLAASNEASGVLPGADHKYRWWCHCKYQVQVLSR